MRHDPTDSVLETELETGPEKVPAKVRFPCFLGVVAPEQTRSRLSLPSHHHL